MDSKTFQRSGIAEGVSTGIVKPRHDDSESLKRIENKKKQISALEADLTGVYIDFQIVYGTTRLSK